MRRSSKSSRQSTSSSASTQSLSPLSDGPRVSVAQSGVFPPLTNSVTDVISIPMGRHNYSGELNPDDSDNDSWLERSEESEETEGSEGEESEDEDEEDSFSDRSQAEEVENEDDEEGSEKEEEDGDDIRGVQRSEAVGVSIPKRAFHDLVREIGAEESTTGPIRFTGEAMNLLQSEAEKVLVEMFSGANALAEAAGRDEVQVVDVYASRQMSHVLKKADP